MCGEGLSQEGLMESFLKDDPEHEIVLPRHRSFWFYMAITGIVILALAVFAGAGYLVYRIAWGENEAKNDGGEVVDMNQDYTDPELGFTISYPENWSLELGSPAENELAALTLSLSAQKNMELRVYQLDPVISIGGIEAIEEYLVEDATGRIIALGGQPGSSEASQPKNSQTGYGQEGTSTSATGETTAPDETDETSTDEMFTSTHISGLPAFYTEFTANIMGEETKFLLYYIVAGDYIFVFQARSPAGEYKDARPQFYSITGSFKWEQILEEQTPDETPDISSTWAPVITLC
jgi:hypothetical protein